MDLVRGARALQTEGAVVEAEAVGNHPDDGGHELLLSRAPS